MNLYYNTTAQCRVDENNVRLAEKPRLTYAACPTWELHFLSGNPSETPEAVDLSDIVSWRAAVDSDWKDNTGPMCRTLDADIDASQAAQGIISVPVDANTQAYHSAVNGKQSVPGWFELRGFDDSGNVALVCLLTITCNNSIDPTGGAEPEPVDNDTATMTWVRAVIAEQLYYQYSADGSTWHNPPMVPETDVYFRVKHGENGTPSAAQLIPYGPQGDTGDAAGFGTPTASASTLAAGFSATATVTASGPDTAKVFSFEFGIPKGDKGDQGEPGTFSDTSFLTFDSVSASNLVTLTSDCVPVAVKTDAGSYYPIEKQSVTLGTGSFTLDVTPYLAYDNAASFSGTWTVFMAAGLPGEQQDGNEIITLTSTAITPEPDTVYKRTLQASDTFTIDTSVLTATKQLTFELHITQPGTAVSFTLPAVLWADGDAFASGNPAPVMSTASTEYCLVFRWDGVSLLGNLAYTKAVSA